MILTIIACVGILLMVFAAKTDGTQRMSIFQWGVVAALAGCVISLFTGSFGSVLVWGLVTLVAANIVFSFLFRNLIPRPLFERQLTAKDMMNKTLYYRYSHWRGQKWRKRMIKVHGIDPFKKD